MKKLTTIEDKKNEARDYFAMFFNNFDINVLDQKIGLDWLDAFMDRAYTKGRLDQAEESNKK